MKRLIILPYLALNLYQTSNFGAPSMIDGSFKSTYQVESISIERIYNMDFFNK